MPAWYPRRLPTQSRRPRWHFQPLRHRRTAESGRVEGRSKRAHAREGCSGRQTAARPALQAAARSTRSVRPNSPRQPAPQRSRLEVVRACRACRAHRCIESGGGGSCGGGFPAGGAGGSGRRTVASLPSVSIAPSGAAVPAAAAVSSAPLWRGGDESDRWRRKRRARGERGVGAGAPVPAESGLPAQRMELRVCPFRRPFLPFELIFEADGCLK